MSKTALYLGLAAAGLVGFYFLRKNASATSQKDVALGDSLGFDPRDLGISQGDGLPLPASGLQGISTTANRPSTANDVQNQIAAGDFMFGENGFRALIEKQTQVITDYIDKKTGGNVILADNRTPSNTSTTNSTSGNSVNQNTPSITEPARVTPDGTRIFSVKSPNFSPSIRDSTIARGSGVGRTIITGITQKTPETAKSFGNTGRFTRTIFTGDKNRFVQVQTKNTQGKFISKPRDVSLETANILKKRGLLTGVTNANK